MALIEFVVFLVNSTDTKSYDHHIDQESSSVNICSFQVKHFELADFVKHFELADFKVNSEFIDFVALIEFVDFLANSTDTKSYEYHID